MAFKVFRKSDLIAGAIVFGFPGMLFLMIATFGDQPSFDRIRVSGALLSPGHPEFTHYVRTLRVGAGIAGAACWLLSWLAFRYSRKTADA